MAKISGEGKDQKKRRRKRAAPGPEADRLALAGDWKKNVQTALGKRRPKEGWPKE
jgi:hypothetical protein